MRIDHSKKLYNIEILFNFKTSIGIIAVCLQYDMVLPQNVDNIDIHT